MSTIIGYPPDPVAVPLGRPVQSAPSARLPALLPTLAPWRVGLTAVLICGLLLLNKLGTPGSIVFFSILAVMIVRSPEWAFLALMLSALGLLTNMAIVPKTSVWTVARLAIIFVCLIRFSIDLAMTRQSLFRKPYYWALLAFSGAAAFCSMISGYYVHIALLKLMNFAVGMSAVLAGALVLHSRRTDLSHWFVAIAAAIVANGFLAMALGVGYGRSVMGDLYATSQFFQGPFFHPNACGPFCALLVVLLFSTWLFSGHRGRWICLALIPPLLYFLWLSKSRTGFASLVIGVFVVLALTLAPAAKRLVRLRLNISRTNLFILASITTVAIMLADVGSGGRIGAGLREFILKYDAKQGELDVDTVTASRRPVIERSWQLFLERPWTGLGFQVSVDPYFVQNATLFSAPVEKGFLPTALLEEVGILGTTLFVLFLLALAGALWRQRNAPGLAMFLTYLATNFGEVSIFAFGGAALFGWMLVAAGMLIGDHCLVIRQPSPRLVSLRR